MRKYDLSGKKFGRLTVIGFSEVKENKSYWNCICECGNTTIVVIDSLNRGLTKSCGCLRKEKNKQIATKHNLSTTKIYRAWRSMLERCNNIKIKSYKDYGGRGIKVCDEWQDFETFYRDMGEKPEGLSLDRINNDGDYCKDNCKWSTYKEQANNKRNTIHITYKGRTQTLYQWSEELNKDAKRLYSRIFKQKWDVERAFERKMY